MQIRLKLVVCALLALLVYGGCSDDESATEVVISIDADQALREKLTRVDVESYDTTQMDSQGRPKQTGKRSFDIKSDSQPSGVSFAFSFGAVKNKSDSFLLVVTGYEGAQAVVEQKARVGFVNGQTRALSILLASACYQQLCAERGSSDWFERSCDNDQATCSGVTTPDTVVVGGDDAGGASEDGGAREGGSNASEGGSGSGDALKDGGSSTSMEAGTSSGDAGQMDAGDGASNGSLDSGNSDGGPKDSGSMSDVQTSPTCGTQTCPTTAHCVQPPSAHCECNTGYTGNGTTCTPTSSNPNDCQPNSCPAPHTCVDGNGDFSCTCAAGYVQVTAKTCALGFVSISSNGDSVGSGTNCARRSDGSVACWGRNIYGQFGLGGEEQAVDVPKLTAFNNYAEVVVGGNFICGRRSDGTVYCAGSNVYGSLGRGATGDSTVPVQVMGLSGAVELAAGESHACARRSNGTVACWGDNEAGQLGNGMSGQGMRALAPVEVTGLANAVEIAAGVSHTCARRNESGGTSSVVCWGTNSSGQLGNGTTTSTGGTLVTVMTGGSSALVNPTGLALGQWHSCALLASGGVACWGADGSSQLGNAGGDSPVPAAVVSLTDAVEVAANRFYTCARRTNGSVSCWGDWPGRDALSAITMVASGAAEIGAGYYHTCVRKTDGSAVCWGENRYGQIGNGATQGDADPPVLTATAVRAVAP